MSSNLSNFPTMVSILIVLISIPVILAYVFEITDVLLLIIASLLALMCWPLISMGGLICVDTIVNMVSSLVAIPKPKRN